MILIIVILLLAALFLFLLAPSFGMKRAEHWRGTAFAHRGLHGNGVDENSIAAFEKACAAGFGIELDVQLTRDGVPVIFHDDDLKRVLGDCRRVDAVDYAELSGMRLPAGGCVPSFEDALQCVKGRVPLLVELKNGKRNDELCRKTLALLSAYEGSFIIESFSPFIVRWFRKHAPEIIRGQLVSSMENYMPPFGKCVAWLLASLALNFLARPDFVAYDLSVDFAAPRIQRALFKTPMVCWTVKDVSVYRAAVNRGEMPIFEGFLPEK